MPALKVTPVAGAVQATRQDRGDVKYDNEEEVTADAQYIDYLEEEERPAYQSHVSASDLALGLLLLGVVVCTPLVKFLLRCAVQRLDTLLCVEGELRRDAAHRKREGQTSASGTAPWQYPSSPTSTRGWVRHLLQESHRRNAFLRGARADLSFHIATDIANATLIFGVVLLDRSLRVRGLLEAQQSRNGVWFAQVFAVPLAAALLQWPLRAARMCVLVNYQGDAALPGRESTTSGVSPDNTPHRYRSATEVCQRIRRDVGVRGLLRNGFTVSLTQAAVTLLLIQCMVNPLTRWASAIGRAAPTAAPSSTSALLTRAARVAIAAAVAGAALTLQQPFRVVLTRMMLLPADEARGERPADTEATPSNKQEVEAAVPRRGCRYESGWACATHVAQREGVSALFAGLPLRLATSLLLPTLAAITGGSFDVVFFEV